MNSKTISSIGPVLTKLRAIPRGICNKPEDYRGAGNDGFSIDLISIKDQGQYILSGEFVVAFKRCEAEGEWRITDRMHGYMLNPSSKKKTNKFLGRDILVSLNGKNTVKVTELIEGRLLYRGKFEISAKGILTEDEYQAFKSSGILPYPLHFKTLAETISALNIESVGTYKVCIGTDFC